MTEHESEKKIRKLFEQFENFSEQGQTSEAVRVIGKACLEAASTGRPDLVVETFNHKLHIFKHLFQRTGQEIYLSLMRSEALSAVNLAKKYRVQGSPRAAALLRYADTFYLEDDYKKSTPIYLQALEALPKAASGEYAEFLSHWAISAIKLRKEKKNLEQLKQALSMAESDIALRPFHKLIVVSGIQGRLAEACGVLNDREQAENYLLAAEGNAKILEKEYHMPMRQIQLKNLKLQLNF